MRQLMYLLRFFRAVPPLPPLMIGTFVLMTGVASLAVFVSPERAAGLLVPILVLQLFAASSGFGVPARRGHYDLLLTRGGRRLNVALSHWAASVAPGVASWLIIAAVELAVRPAEERALLTSGTFAAVSMVSTLPWALTVALPRFSGGVGWLLVFVTSAALFPTRPFDEWNVRSTELEALVWPAWVFLVNPVATVGKTLAFPHLLAVAPGVALASLSMFIACMWASRADVPLEAAQ